jgi:hypothetical protein
MRKPKISTKRALGLALAASLAIGATVAIAGSSEAAAAKYTLGSTTTSTGQKMSVKGTDFTDEGGASLIDLANISFETGTCPANKSLIGAALGTSAVAVTDTRITLIVPTLTLTNSKPTKYNVCFYDTNVTAASSPLVGQAAVTAYAVPNSFTIVSGTGGPSYGGTKMIVTGQDFTNRSNITIGGAPATGTKVVLGKTASDLDTITAFAPANSGLVSTIRVTGEAGPVTTGQTFTYTNAIKVSPSGSDGVAGRVVTITGTGFNSLSWAAALTLSKSSIAFVKAGTTLSAFYSSGVATPAGALVCSAIDVVSDTELECTIPSMTGAYGAYTAVIVTYSASAYVAAGSSAGSTGYSRGATYTAAPF